MSIDGIGEYGTGNYVVKNNSAILTVVVISAMIASMDINVLAEEPDIFNENYKER
ncbi:MAG: hypothetical protein PHY47_27275 [Lachnospiraceae bacterium]|nr:hypothetical protein [Lachnospiraceae bacterium]